MCIYCAIVYCYFSSFFIKKWFYLYTQVIINHVFKKNVVDRSFIFAHIVFVGGKESFPCEEA